MSDFFREAVPVLFQAVTGVEIGVLNAARYDGEVADAEVNVDSRCLGIGGIRRVNFVLTDKVEFLLFLRAIVDGTDLLQIFDSDTEACLVFDENVFPRLRVFFMIRTFSGTDTVVLDVVTDAVLLPRRRTAWVVLRGCDDTVDWGVFACGSRADCPCCRRSRPTS